MKKNYSTNDNIKFMFNLAWNNQKKFDFHADNYGYHNCWN